VYLDIGAVRTKPIKPPSHGPIFEFVFTVEFEVGYVSTRVGNSTTLTTNDFSIF
jgi:hypothetical protein